MAEKLVDGLIARHGVFAEFNGYRLVPVYQNVGPVARQAIIRLWTSNNILPPHVAEERAKQVLFMIIGPQDDLVGVNTVYIGDFSRAGWRPVPSGSFYFYRMFIRVQNRIPRLSFKTLDLTYDYLSALPSAASRPQGLVLVTENPKLMKPGAQRMLQKMGWTPIGKNELGQITMKRDFPKPC